jgi:ureidoglycolate lyase
MTVAREISPFHRPAKLHLGTWHVGPFFVPDEVSFFNLELADTNVVDHRNCDLAATHGCGYEIVLD